MSSHLKTMPSRLAGRMHLLHWHPVVMGSGGGTIIRTFSLRCTTPITLTVLPSLMYLERKEGCKRVRKQSVEWNYTKKRTALMFYIEIRKLLFKVWMKHMFYNWAVQDFHEIPSEASVPVTSVINRRHFIFITPLKPDKYFYALVAPCNSSSLLNGTSCFNERY